MRISHYNLAIDNNNYICKKLEVQINEFKTEERDILNKHSSYRFDTSSEISFLSDLNLKLLQSKSGNSISSIYWNHTGHFLPKDITRYSGNVQFLSQPTTIFHEGQFTIKQNNRIVGEFASEYIYSLEVFDNAGYEYYDNKKKR